MPKIFTKYDDYGFVSRGDIPNPDTPCYVDDVGYINMEQQIKGLINAGINLENYRRSQYDYQYVDVPSDGNFEVSPENNPDFMPSVDMPSITENLISNLDSAVAKRSEETKNEVINEDVSVDSNLGNSEK